MVAVISSELAGVFSSSSSVIGQAGRFGQANMGQAGEQLFVNAATGGLIVQGQDERLTNIGLNFGVLRTYSSFGDLNGDHWRTNMLGSLSLSGGANQTGSVLTRTASDGAEQTFIYDSVRSLYQSTQGAGAHDTIVLDAEGRGTYTEGSSLTVMRYDSQAQQGRLLSHVDKDGLGVVFEYDSEGRVARAKTSSLNQLGVLVYQTQEFTYDDQGNLSHIQALNVQNNLQTHHYYNYDTLGRLSQVTIDLSPADNSIVDGAIYTTNYEYLGDSKLISAIKQSDGTQTSFTYDGVTGKIATITDGDGVETSFEYRVDNGNRTRVLVAGREYLFDYDEQGQLLAKSAVLNGREVGSRYSYDSDGNVEKVTDGLGNYIEYRYDDNGNQIMQQDATGHRIEKQFDANNRLLSETQFLQADPDGDGPLQASKPVTIRYVYDDDNNLRFIVSQEGRVTENRYNGLSQLSQERQYRQHHYDIAGLTAGEHITEQQLMTWVGEVNANSLEPDAIQLQDFFYDFRGQLESQVSYGTITSQGAGEPNTAHASHFSYDQQGRLLSRTSDENRQTQYTYDGLGRMLSQSDTDYQTQATKTLQAYSYDDQGRTLTVRSLDNLHITSSFDRNGRLIEVARYKVDDPGTDGDEAVSYGTNRFFYDGQGRQVAERHANGAISYQLYDGIGRLDYAVDRTGAVSQFHYDDTGRLTQTTLFNTLVDTSSWFDFENQIPFTAGGAHPATLLANIELQTALASPSFESVDDRQSHVYYDASGRIRFSQDAEGYTTETRYDGAGRQTHSIAYAQADLSIVDIDGEPTLASDSINSESRITRSFYTDDGLLQGTIDAEGYAAQIHYDAAGFTVGETRYVNSVQRFVGQALSAEDRVALSSWDDVIISAASTDQVNHTRYNGRGLMTQSLTHDGRFTEYRYTGDGQLEQRIDYAQRSVSPNTIAAPISAPSLQAEDRITVFYYNGRGQIETEISGTRSQSASNTAAGVQSRQKTEYFYDDLGRLLGTQISDMAETAVRAGFSQLDALGRTIGALDASDSATLTHAGQYDTVNQTTVNESLRGEKYVYDAKGRMVSSTDREGNSQYFYYDKRNQLIATINSGGDVQTITYNRFGEQIEARSFAKSLAVNAFATPLLGGDLDGPLRLAVESLTDLREDIVVSQSYTKRGLLDISNNALNGRIDADYNAFGELVVRTSDLSGAGQVQRQDHYNYSRRGQLLQSVMDAQGERINSSNRYDGFGRLISQTDANGNETNYQYADNIGRSLTSYQTANGQVTEITEVDVFGRTVSMTNANGESMQYQYDGTNRKQWITNELGDTTELSYDHLGQLTDRKQGSFNGTNGLSAVLNHTQYRYDIDGNQLEVTEGVGTSLPIKTNYVYDDNNRLIQSTLDSKAAHENINRTQHVHAVTEFRYDHQNRMVASQDAEGYLTFYAYNAQGQLKYQVEKDRSATGYTYDAAGRQTSTQRFSLRHANLHTFDSVDDSPSVEQLDEWLKNSDAARSFSVYDQAGRAVLSIDAEGGVTQNRYNARGLVTEQTRFATASLALLIERQENRFALTKALEDGSISEAQLASLKPVVNSQDQMTATVYDEIGRAVFSLEKIVNSNGGAPQAIVKQSSYDAAGRLVHTQAFAETIDYSNDYQLKIDQTNNQSYLDVNGFYAKRAAPENRQSWLYYDNVGQLRFNIDSLGGISENRYDSAGRLTESIAYADRLAQMPGESDNNIQTIVQQLTPGGFNADDRITRNVYDALGRVVQRTQVTDVNADTGISERWTYHANGLKQSYTNASDNTWSYKYDSGGRLSREISPQVTIYTRTGSDGKYDLNAPLRQVTARQVSEFKYDDLGNVKSRTQGYSVGSNVNNAAIKHAVTTTFNYDAMGRQTLVQTLDGSDFFGNHPSNSVSVSSSVIYNALGQAVVEIKNTATPIDGVTETNELLDRGPLTIYQYKVYDDLGRLLFDVDAEGYVTNYKYDALGNQVELVRYEHKVSFNLLQLQDWRPGNAISFELIEPQLDSLGDARSKTFDYDSLGRVVAEKLPIIDYAQIDEAGRVALKQGRPQTNYQYNSFNERVLTQQSRGDNLTATSAFYYDNLGNKIAAIDAENYLSTWSYDSLNQVTSSHEYAQALGQYAIAILPSITIANTSSDDRHWSYLFDSLGRQTEQRQTQIIYHELQGSAPTTNEVIGGQDKVLTQYDALGNITRIEKNDVVTNNNYDVLGRLTSSVRDTGAVTTQAVTDNSSVYNLGQDSSQSVDVSTELRHLTSLQYDVHGNRVRSTEGQNGGSEHRSTEYRYNSLQQMVRSTDAEGVNTEFYYNHLGDVVSQVKDYFVARDYYEFGTPTAQLLKEAEDAGEPILDPDLGVTVAYKPLHVREQIPFPSWLQFDESTGVISGTAPDDVVGLEFSIQISYVGKVERTITKVIDALKDEVVNEQVGSWLYENSKGVLRQSQIAYEYDLLGQQTAVSYTENSAIVIEEHRRQEQIYNAFGEVVRKGDPRITASGVGLSSLQELYSYNAAGQLTASNQGDGVNKSYYYDLAGNLIWQRHPTKGITRFEVDNLGRVAIRYQAEAVVENEYVTPKTQQSYDRWGNIVKFVDPLNVTTSYKYNHQNLMTQETRHAVKTVMETGSIDHAYVATTKNYYDINGKLIAQKNGNGHWVYNYFSKTGQLTQSQNQTGDSSWFGYNIYSEQIAVQNALGYVTTETVDKLGRVIETGDIRRNESDPTGGRQYQALNQFSLNELGHRIQQARIKLDQNSLSRDADGRLILNESNANITVLANDSLGQTIRSISPAGFRMSFAYDRLGRQVLERYDDLYNNGANGQGTVDVVEANKNQNTKLYGYFGKLLEENDLGANHTLYGYEHDQLVIRNRDFDSGALADQNLYSTYYDNGQLRSMYDSSTDNHTFYRYNASGQLVFEERYTQNNSSNTDGLKNRLINESIRTEYDSHGRISEVTVYEMNENVIVDTRLELIDWSVNSFYNSPLVDHTVKDALDEGRLVVRSQILYAYDAMGNRRVMEAVNGYDKIILDNANTPPELHPAAFTNGAYLGLPIASAGHNYTPQTIGNVSQLFHDAEQAANSLDFELFMYSGDIDNPTAIKRFDEVFPGADQWLDVKLNDQGELQIYLQGTSTVPSFEQLKSNISSGYIRQTGSGDNTQLLLNLMVRAAEAGVDEVDSINADHFVFLPTTLAVVKDLAPRYASIAKQNELEDILEGLKLFANTPFNAGSALTVDLQEYIKDPDINKAANNIGHMVDPLNFSSLTIKSEGHSASAIDGLAQWLDITLKPDGQFILTAKPNHVIPEYWANKVLILSYQVSDGINATDFELQLNFDSFFMKPELGAASYLFDNGQVDEQGLGQSIDLSKLVSGADLASLTFKVEEPEDGHRYLLSNTKTNGSVITYNPIFNARTPNTRDITVTVERSGETLIQYAYTINLVEVPDISPVMNVDVSSATDDISRQLRSLISGEWQSYEVDQEFSWVYGIDPDTGRLAELPAEGRISFSGAENQQRIKTTNSFETGGFRLRVTQGVHKFVQDVMVTMNQAVVSVGPQATPVTVAALHKLNDQHFSFADINELDQITFKYQIDGTGPLLTQQELENSLPWLNVIEQEHVLQNDVVGQKQSRGLTINSNNQILPPNARGNHNIKILAFDGHNPAAVQYFRINVTAPNNPTASLSSNTLEEATNSAIKINIHRRNADGARIIGIAGDLPPGLEFEQKNGQYTGRIVGQVDRSLVADATAVYDFNVILQGQERLGGVLQDIQSGEVLIPLRLTINDKYLAPSFTNTPNTQVSQHDRFTYTPALSLDPKFSGAEDPRVTFSITNKPSWANFYVNTGVLSGIPDKQSMVGDYNNIRIRVNDGQKTTDLAPFSISVKDVNDAPVITNSPTNRVNAYANSNWSFSPNVVDADGDAVSFSFEGLPSWVTTQNTSTGYLSGKPNNSNIGTSRVVITASDGQGGVDRYEFDLTVEYDRSEIKFDRRGTSFTYTETESVTFNPQHYLTLIGQDGNTVYSPSYKISYDSVPGYGPDFPSWFADAHRYDSRTGILQTTIPRTLINEPAKTYRVLMRVSIQGSSISHIEQVLTFTVLNKNTLPTLTMVGDSNARYNGNVVHGNARFSLPAQYTVNGHRGSSGDGIQVVLADADGDGVNVVEWTKLSNSLPPGLRLTTRGIYLYIIGKADASAVGKSYNVKITLDDKNGRVTRTVTFDIGKSLNTRPVVRPGAVLTRDFIEGVRGTISKSYFQSLFQDDHTPTNELDIKVYRGSIDVTTAMSRDGNFVWTPRPGSADGTIKIVATDKHGASSVPVLFEIKTIDSGNKAPTLSDYGLRFHGRRQTITANRMESYPWSVTLEDIFDDDSDEKNLRFSLDPSSDTAVGGGSRFELITHYLTRKRILRFNYLGGPVNVPKKAKVIAVDARGARATFEVELVVGRVERGLTYIYELDNSKNTVTEYETKPSAKIIPDRLSDNKTPLSIDLNSYFNHPDNTALHYRVNWLASNGDIKQGLPSGLTIDSDNGIIQGTVTQLGQYKLQVIASDGAAEASSFFALDVKEKNYYERGDGDKVINLASSSNEALYFGPGITRADIANIQFVHGGDYIITLTSGETIRQPNWYNGGDIKIPGLHFANGTEFNIVSQLAQYPILGISESENFDYSNFKRILANNNIPRLNLNPGKGDDIVTVGLDADKKYLYHTLHYQLGDGNDVLTNIGAIEFGEGITPENIRLEGHHQGDLYMYLPDGAVVQVKNWHDGGEGYNAHALRALFFKDGSILYGAQLVDIIGTDGNDVFEYGYKGFMYSPGKGDDVVVSTSTPYRSSELRYKLGDGNDTILNYIHTLYLDAGLTPDNVKARVYQGGDLVFHMPDGGEVRFKDWAADGLEGLKPVSQVKFLDGTTWGINDFMHLVGTNADDTLDYTSENNLTDFRDRPINRGAYTYEGGLGDDTILTGQSRGETVVYHRGDGNDRIIGGNRVDLLLPDYSYQDVDSAGPNGIERYRDGDDFLIRFRDTDHTITIVDHFAGGDLSNRQLGSVTFGDLTLDNFGHTNNIKPDNFAPSALGMADLTLDNAADISSVGGNIAASFRDLENEPLSFKASVLINLGTESEARTPLPGSLRLDGLTGQFSGFPNIPGVYIIEVEASDGTSSTRDTFTLTVNEHNFAAHYIGERNVTVSLGESITLSVAFADANNDLVNASAKGLPSWLHYDKAMQTLSGNVPANSNVGDIVIDLLAHDGQALSRAQVVLRVLSANAVTPTEPAFELPPLDIELPDHRFLYSQNNFNHSVSDAFDAIEGPLSWTVTQRLEGGNLVNLDAGHWLHFSDGVFSGQPSMADVGLINLQVSATNAQGESIRAQLALQVDGPQAEDIGVQLFINEAGKRQIVNIDVSDYFTGVSEQTRYGIRMELPEADVESGSLTPRTLFAQAAAANQVGSEVIIPAPLDKWLSFDAQTGILRGLPPAEYLAKIKFVALAEDPSSNVSLSSSGHIKIAAGAHRKEYWFSYDAANRVVLDGVQKNNKGKLGLQHGGQYLEYDALGRASTIVLNRGRNAQHLSYTDQSQLIKVEQSYEGNYLSSQIKAGDDLYDKGWDNDTQKLDESKWGADIQFGSLVKHSYDALGQKTKTTNYYTPGSGSTYNRGDFYEFEDENSSYNFTDKIHNSQTFRYNADSKISKVEHRGVSFGSADSSLSIASHNKHSSTTLLSNTEYKYDSAGRLENMFYNQKVAAEGAHPEDKGAFINKHEYSYEARGNYLEREVRGKSVGTSAREPGLTETDYDANGNRAEVREYRAYQENGLNRSAKLAETRRFQTTVDGKLIYKETTVHSQFAGQFSSSNPKPEIASSHYLYAGQQYLGEMKTDGSINVKSSHFSGVDVKSPQGSARHQVRSGDTLRALAVQFLGNADYWYIIADANGLSANADDALMAGQTLEIPQVQQNTNRHDTFSPHNVAELIGSTTPNLPFLPIPPEQSCNAIAAIIIVVIAVVVTAGAGAALLSTASGLFVGGGGTLTALGAATAAAAGSAASQLAAVAFGVQDSFSWKQVAISAVTAGVTQGISNQLSVGGDLTTLNAAELNAADASVWTNVSSKGVVQLSRLGRASVGLAGYGASTLTSKVLGEPSRFSWAAAAGTALSSAAGGALANEKGQGSFLQDLGSAALGSGLQYATEKALGGDRSWDGRSVLADAFGNSLGNSIARNMLSGPKPPKPTPVPALSGLDQLVDGHMEGLAQAITEDNLAKSVSHGAGKSMAKAKIEAFEELSGRRSAVFNEGLGVRPAAAPSTDERMRVATAQARAEYDSTFGVNGKYTSTGVTFSDTDIDLGAYTRSNSVENSWAWRFGETLFSDINSIATRFSSHEAALYKSSHGFANIFEPLYKGVASNGRFIGMSIGALEGELSPMGYRQNVSEYWQSWGDDISLVGGLAAEAISGNPESAAHLFPAVVAVSVGGSKLANDVLQLRAAKAVVPVSITGNAVDLARSWQTQFPYVGQDPMRPITLPEGKVLAQVVFDADAGPAGSYFTTPSAVRRATLADGSIDANILNQGLQIDGSKHPSFRPNVQYFQVNEAIPHGEAAFGRTIANQHLNPDGYNALPQVFLKEGYFNNLKPVDMSGNPDVKAYPMINTDSPSYLFDWLPKN